MSLTFVGDMSQHFQTLRQTSSIKARMNTLTEELSSGQVSDISTHLRGDVGQLALVDRELEMISSFETTATQLSGVLQQKQLVLSSLDARATKLAAQLIGISQSSSPLEIGAAESAGRATFNGIVDALNTRVGDKSLFSGAATDRTPLADGEAMLADIVASIGGAVDNSTIAAAIDTWFDDPAGGFATMGYAGDTGSVVTQRIGQQETMTLDGRADDAGLRKMLKSAAFAAVSDVMSVSLVQSVRAALVSEGGEALFTASDQVRQISARIGEDEARIEELSTMRAAQKTTFSMARNALVNADSFETATYLQSVQQQLELHFTATARMSRLSLVNFL